MTTVVASSGDPELLNEFDRVKASLYAKLDAIANTYSNTSRTDYFLRKAYDHVDAARSLDTLYVYDRLMCVQGIDTYRLFLLDSAMKLVRGTLGGEINPVFTQAHVDRLSNFEFITHKNEGRGMFPSVTNRNQQTAYLDTMRAAFILGDDQARKYVSTHFDPVCDVVVRRDLTDPKLLLEVIEVMGSGSTALVDGTL